MTARDITKANIECRCDDRIGFNFDGGRRNELAGAGVARQFQVKKWVENGYDFFTDE